MSYRCRRLVAFIALESWASHAASYPSHSITLSRIACDYSSPNYHSQQLIAPGLGRARFASRGGAPNKNIGFPRGGVVPPRDLRGLSRGGVGLTPQEAEEGQTPQKLRLERGKGLVTRHHQTPD